MITTNARRERFTTNVRERLLAWTSASPFASRQSASANARTSAGVVAASAARSSSIVKFGSVRRRAVPRDTVQFGVMLERPDPYATTRHRHLQIK